MSSSSPSWGHDLRNPLASIAGGLRLLKKKVDAEGADWINRMQASVNRMSGLIDNVMDFARVCLGGGMQLKLQEELLNRISGKIIASSRMPTRTAASRQPWMHPEK